jgi:hypothetical protein
MNSSTNEIKASCRIVAYARKCQVVSTPEIPAYRKLLPINRLGSANLSARQVYSSPGATVSVCTDREQSQQSGVARPHARPCPGGPKGSQSITTLWNALSARNTIVDSPRSRSSRSPLLLRRLVGVYLRYVRHEQQESAAFQPRRFHASSDRFRGVDLVCHAGGGGDIGRGFSACTPTPEGTRSSDGR